MDATYTQAANYTALATLIALVIKLTFKIEIPADQIITVLIGLVGIAGIIQGIRNHKALAQATGTYHK